MRRTNIIHTHDGREIILFIASSARSCNVRFVRWGRIVRWFCVMPIYLHCTFETRSKLIYMRLQLCSFHSMAFLVIVWNMKVAEMWKSELENENAYYFGAWKSHTRNGIKSVQKIHKLYSARAFNTVHSLKITIHLKLEHLKSLIETFVFLLFVFFSTHNPPNIRRTIAKSFIAVINGYTPVSMHARNSNGLTFHNRIVLIFQFDYHQK